MNQLEGTIQQVGRVRSGEVPHYRMIGEQVVVLSVPFREPVMQSALVCGRCLVACEFAAATLSDVEDLLVERQVQLQEPHV